jgi:hypothetical protein
MKILLSLLFFVSVCLADDSGAPEAAPAKLALPNHALLRGADPHAIAVGNTIWVYPTWSERGHKEFFAFSSTNLVDWERHGPVLDSRMSPGLTRTARRFIIPGRLPCL